MWPSVEGLKVGKAMENVPAVSHLGIVRELQRLGSIVPAGMLPWKP